MWAIFDNDDLNIHREARSEYHRQDDIFGPRRGLADEETTLPTSSNTELVHGNATTLSRCWKSARRDSLQNRCGFTSRGDEGLEMTISVVVGVIIDLDLSMVSISEFQGL